MKPLIKSEDSANECEAGIEYDDNAITIIVQLQNILANLQHILSKPAKQQPQQGWRGKCDNSTQTKYWHRNKT